MVKAEDLEARLARLALRGKVVFGIDQKTAPAVAFVRIPAGNRPEHVGHGGPAASGQDAAGFFRRSGGGVGGHRFPRLLRDPQHSRNVARPVTRPAALQPVLFGSFFS